MSARFLTQARTCTYVVCSELLRHGGPSAIVGSLNAKIMSFLDEIGILDKAVHQWLLYSEDIGNDSTFLSASLYVSKRGAY